MGVPTSVPAAGVNPLWVERWTRYLATAVLSEDASHVTVTVSADRLAESAVGVDGGMVSVGTTTSTSAEGAEALPAASFATIR